jgi:hypothetical protein
MRTLITKDVLAGLLFMAFGAAGLWLGADYRMGTMSRMGPGYMPRVLCWSLVAVGVVVMLRGVFAGYEAIRSGRWRPIACITFGIIAFALLIDRMGLLAAGSVLVALGSLGGPEFKWREAVVLVVVLLAVCVGIFVWGLGLSITVLPR